MSVDAYILVKIKDGIDLSYVDLYSAGTFNIEIVKSYNEQFKTQYSIECIGTSYFDENYPKGNWGKLCSILMSLLSNQSVECVYYFGDNDTGDSPKPITAKRIIELCNYYMLYGNRQYYKFEDSNVKAERDEFGRLK